MPPHPRENPDTLAILAFLMSVLALLVALGVWARYLFVGLLLLVASPTYAQTQDDALVMPTAFYLTASAVDWATAAPACQIGCKSRTGLLPYVEDARVSVPIGLLLDVGVILLAHKVLAPKWPKLAAGILYALTIVRSVNAADHLIVQRDWNRRSKAGVP